MKKAVGFFVIFGFFVCGLVAQTSSMDFYVNQQNTGHLDNYSTWEMFVTATDRLIEMQRKSPVLSGHRIVWVKEPTRMENDLVSRAYQELPNTTRIGSAYLIQFISINMVYNVYIYSDPDGERYYRLLRAQW
ncbi:hypothetical protein AGMMS50267_14630 [Spirochaetia bacterium]|nr:hypothetical protein AGMMS50267_14630 [Spirochaetia bacterium]